MGERESRGRPGAGSKAFRAETTAGGAEPGAAGQRPAERRGGAGAPGAPARAADPRRGAGVGGRSASARAEGPGGSRRESAPSRLFPLPRSPPTRRGSFRPPRRSGRCAPRPRRIAASPPSARRPASRSRAAAFARGAASPPARLLHARAESVEGRDWWRAEAVRLRRPAPRGGRASAAGRLGMPGV